MAALDDFGADKPRRGFVFHLIAIFLVLFLATFGSYLYFTLSDPPVYYGTYFDFLSDLFRTYVGVFVH